MEVTRLNVQALGLLQKDRAPEADRILTRALAIDAKNPFTLNNLGFAKEQEGELEAALSYYNQSANLHSQEPVIVTVHDSWRGQPISQVAGDNASEVRKLMRRERNEDRSTRVARLNLQGVSALNRNDRRSARDYFQQAYKLDPKNAFILNNMGYLSELDGDRETAQFYYDKAQSANRANDRVGVATRKDAEGRRLANVADSSDQLVEQRMRAEAAQRRKAGPPSLKRRGGAVLGTRETSQPEPEQQAPQPSTAPKEQSEPQPQPQPDEEQQQQPPQ